MSVLKSITKDNMIQIRFRLDGRWIVIVGKTLVDALKQVDAYKPVYL